MDTIVDVLRSKGHKITSQRRAVINALLECGEFPTALQLLNYVKKMQPDVSLDTVYRNISLLKALGLVNEIQTGAQEGSRFEILKEGDHHHHVVCLGCGKVQCLDFCPIGSTEIEQVEKDGFSVVSHSLDFYGYCKECQMDKS
ncbi:MAG: Fur family transcriptional regulator [Acidaminococcaceae bacterium]